jgi:GntR family transcriptional activator of glc operon
MGSTGRTSSDADGLSARAEGRQVAEIVAERIERLIMDGILKVGDPLPSERRLCEKLGASRSAVREGLRILRSLGLIETRHGKASFVARLTASRDTSPLMHLFNSQPRTLYDLLEVRVILEGEAARLAALRATPSDLIMIRRRYDEMVEKQGALSEVPLEEHARLDHGFHRAINDASHNPVLVHTLESLSDLMLGSVFASVRNLYHRPGYKKVIDRQHQRLYEAVLKRDPARAERVAREHVKGVGEMFMEIEQEEQRLVRAAMRLEGWR